MSPDKHVDLLVNGTSILVSPLLCTGGRIFLSIDAAGDVEFKTEEAGEFMTAVPQVLDLDTNDGQTLETNNSLLLQTNGSSGVSVMNPNVPATLTSLTLLIPVEDPSMSYPNVLVTQGNPSTGTVFDITTLSGQNLTTLSGQNITTLPATNTTVSKYIVTDSGIQIVTNDGRNLVTNIVPQDGTVILDAEGNEIFIDVTGYFAYREAIVYDGYVSQFSQGAYITDDYDYLVTQDGSLFGI